MGTVPYMAPEQHAGETADARSDQFAFCIALYEALYGVRPFTGKTRDEVRSAALAGDVPPPPGDSDVPPWVDRAIRRGLAHDPAARWPSMDALLRILEAPEEHDVGRRARVAFGAVAGLVFMTVPFASRQWRVPFDLTRYGGSITLSIVLMLLVAIALVVGRATLLSTSFNRRALFVLFGALVLQIPMIMGHAALGLPVADSQILQIFFWCVVSTIFALTVDRRFLVVSACFLVAFLAALAWRAQLAFIIAGANVAFVACVVIAWRAPPAREGSSPGDPGLNRRN